MIWCIRWPALKHNVAETIDVANRPPISIACIDFAGSPIIGKI